MTGKTRGSVALEAWCRERSQRELVDALAERGHRCSQQAVSSWIAGTRMPRLPLAIAMQELLGIDVGAWTIPAPPPTKRRAPKPRPR